MDHVIVYVVIVAAMILFITEKLRYDVVALLALVTLGVLDIIPDERMFAGFGHPAVITVAAILVVSKGLMNGGVVDFIARGIGSLGGHAHLQMVAMIGVVIVASAFMNNVGALALMMPVAIRVARRHDLSPSVVLMPLAFGSLLGGLITLIGTPPNIIIATYRTQTGANAFGMFAFTPVGVSVAAVGGLFLATVGRRLVPYRQAGSSQSKLFHIDDYITECRISDDSPLAGSLVSALHDLTEADAVIVGIVRSDQRLPPPSYYDRLYAGDILILEAKPDDIKELVDSARLELVGSDESHLLNARSIEVMEAIVAHNSPLQGKTAISLNLRRRYGINLLAVARRGKRVDQRLGKIRFQGGDILLLQGDETQLQDTVPQYGLLPLPERELQLGKPRRLAVSLAIFGLALLISALGWLPIATAMIAATLAMILLGLVSLQDAYSSIDWPIIVLLGAMLPVGEALETSGGAHQIADLLLDLGQELPPTLTITLLVTGAMLLSNIVNNAAAAVLMAPIALQLAQGLEVSADPLLMAVAVGTSCAFLTPIGHQSNTLVMGPGGYEFGDYWRPGLPLSLLVIALTTLLVPILWPL